MHISGSRQLPESQDQQEPQHQASSDIASPGNSGDIWIFGFGSLVYKTEFKYSRRLEGCIKGWRRVFWQGSTDHRGTPGAPGRTVTLIESPGDTVWGVAYLLAGAPDHQAETLKYLEWREKQYDQRHKADVYGRDGKKVLVQGALIYIATSNRKNNANWLGEASQSQIAEQIAKAQGPSGRNDEYLYRLADAMREMEVEDPELFALEAAVVAINGKENRKAEGD